MNTDKRPQRDLSSKSKAAPTEFVLQILVGVYLLPKMLLLFLPFQLTLS